MRTSSYIKDRFNYNDVGYGYQLKLIKKFGKINYNFDEILNFKFKLKNLKLLKNNLIIYFKNG